MLQKINLLSAHISFQLNKDIFWFLLKIKPVGRTASFTPYEGYFRSSFAERVSRSRTLREHLKKFFDKFKRLNAADRASVIAAYRNSQYIAEILDDLSFDGSQIQLDALPTTIREVAKDLFLFLYESTLPGFDKKGHYEELFNQIKSTVCPFCGIEKLNHPDFVCQDYDHILFKSKYPFAAVNMTNLIPMGTDCNRNHKKTKDVLYDANGARRKFLNPYVAFINVGISLSGSKVPSGGNDKGSWVINFIPDDMYTQTWSDVFDIRERYKKGELEQYFDRWLGFLKSYLKKRAVTWDETLLRIEFKHTGLSYIENPLDVSNIIRGALFLFLSEYDDPAFFKATLTELNK